MKKKFETPQLEITSITSESTVNTSSLTYEAKQNTYNVLNISTDTLSYGEQNF